MRGKAHVSQALQLKPHFSQVLQVCRALTKLSSFTYMHTLTNTCICIYIYTATHSHKHTQQTVHQYAFKWDY